MMHTNKVLQYFRSRKHLLNISGIAEEANMSKAVLHNAINGGVDGHGTPFLCPKTCAAA